MGRVAWTVIALARLAGRSKAGVESKPSSQAVSPAVSPEQSRSPSKTGTCATTTADGSPRPRAASPRFVKDAGVSRKTSSTQLTNLDRPRGVDAPNDLHAKLSVDTAKAKSAVSDDPAYRTPTVSTFSQAAETPPDPPRRSSMSRSITQPFPSPNPRPISPSPGSSASPSRASTPHARPLVASGRPTLRPRYTTGSKISVSFATGSEIPLSPRSVASDRSSIPSASYASHSRERTPSLISSNSRVTSAYSRSSAALSVATLLGDDHSSAIDIADEESESSIALRMRERRMSGKTLQNARQKILGTLLSSEDLPLDLRQALEEEAMSHMDDPRDHAIHQSLAALEGWKSATTRPSVEVSPRRPTSRPISRCGDVMRVAEEDEVSSNGGSVIEGARPSIIRRTSANGKVYVPKRSASPSRLDGPTSLTGQYPFPVSASLRPVAPLSPSSDQNVPADKDRLRRPVERVERRQSDGISYAAAGMGDRPGNPRNNSMVSLGALGNSSSIFRESLMKASQSQPLQILEINEAGFPPVKYVSWSHCNDQS